MSDEKQISLDDILNQAIDTPAPEPVAEASVETAAEPTETALEKAARERDEKGRFKAKSEEIEPKTTAPEMATESEVPVESTKPNPMEAKPAVIFDDSDGRFRGWGADQKEKFKSLPAEAQELVLELKRDTDAQITRKLEEAAQTKKILEPVSQVLNQTADIFAASGMDPVSAIQGYANIERVLTYGKLDEKLHLLGQIAQRYGIPFAPQQQIEQMDPYEFQKFQMLHDRDAELTRLNSELERTKRENQQFHSQTLAQQVEQFSKAANPDGTPKHPHFEMVKATMGSLLQAGRAKTLDEAYALASEPIEKAFQAREAAARAEAERQRQEAVDRAKKASPVKASAAAPSGKTAAPKGIDAILNSALDQMGL